MVSGRGAIRLSFFLFLSLVFTFSTQAFAEPKPVVKVNKTVLTELDVQEALNEIMPAGVFHGGFSSKKRASKRPRAIEKMIEKELFYQEAKRIGLKPDPEHVNLYLEEKIKKFGSKRKFRDVLKKYGMTEDEYIKKLEKNDLVKKIVKKETEDKAVISDEMVAAYYNGNKKSFLRPKALKLWHIMVSVKPSATKDERSGRKKLINEALSKLKAGEDPSKIAWDYSDDQYRVKGGDYGYVHLGRLNPELEKELLKLKIGQYSGIIETRHGYHVARVEDIKEPEQLSLKAVSPKIKKMLFEESVIKRHNELAIRLKKEGEIHFF